MGAPNAGQSGSELCRCDLRLSTGRIAPAQGELGAGFLFHDAWLDLVHGPVAFARLIGRRGWHDPVARNLC